MEVGHVVSVILTPSIIQLWKTILKQSIWELLKVIIVNIATSIAQPKMLWSVTHIEPIARNKTQITIKHFKRSLWLQSSPRWPKILMECGLAQIVVTKQNTVPLSQDMWSQSISNQPDFSVMFVISFVLPETLLCLISTENMTFAILNLKFKVKYLF